MYRFTSGGSFACRLITWLKVSRKCADVDYADATGFGTIRGVEGTWRGGMGWSCERADVEVRTIAAGKGGRVLVLP